MRKMVVLLLLLSLLLISCEKLEETFSSSAEPVETPVETPAESEEPELILKDGDVEVIQGSVFDAVTLIEGGQYDEIDFSSIDTSMPGEQELVITIEKNGETREYRKKVQVIRPENNLSWEIKTEGPVFLIHPDKLSGSEEEEEYKSFYEYPVFKGEPEETAQKINELIEKEHIWGVSQMFKTMSNSISPEYSEADILQARTSVSEDKEAFVVHTANLIAQYQTGNIDVQHFVTIFDSATGLPISSTQLLERHDLDTEALLKKLNTFLNEQEYYVANMEGVEPYRQDMTDEEMSAYFEELIEQTSSEDYVIVFLDGTLAEDDLEGRMIFIEDGKLFCEFIVFEQMENSSIKLELIEVGAIQ